MNCISYYLALYGLLAAAQARPEAGYNYQQPQTSTYLENDQTRQINFNNEYLPPSLDLSRTSNTQRNSQQIQDLLRSLGLLSRLNRPQVSPRDSSRDSLILDDIRPPGVNVRPQVQPPFFRDSSRDSSIFDDIIRPGFNVRPQVQPPFFRDSSDDFSIASQQPPLVTKDIYVHVAPDEPETSDVRIIQPPAPRKNYKIIFIKAPRASSSRQNVVAPQAPVEEKTLVYVLVDKAQHQSEIILPTPAPTQPSKPEVYFIKYKAQTAPTQIDSDDSVLVGGSQPDLPIVEDLRRSQGLLINSGESISSRFSGRFGQPSSQYGVPGFQKRSAKEKP